MSKYYYNKNFFEKINNEKKAYWLGFLYADGCINRYFRNERLKAMSLEIGLCKKDEDHLNNFLSDIESNVPIKYKSNKLNDNIYESCKVVVCNTKICRDLISLGCIPQKSLILKFPSYNIVPKELMWHFIRGYFDGDGNIFFGEYKGQKEDHKDTINLKLSFVGTKHMLEGIEDFILHNNIPINPSYSEKGQAFSLNIRGFDNIIELYQKLYDGANIFLKRKHVYFTNALNELNIKRNNATSGKRGVYFDKQIKKWIATITKNGVRNRLGSFDNLDDAVESRKKSEIDNIILPT